MSLIPLVDLSLARAGDPPAGPFPPARRSGASIGRGARIGKDADEHRVGVTLAPVELPREVAVVGAGTMGAGIARVFADAGVSVVLCARRESSLEAARDRLGETAARVRLTTSAEEALDGAELVIETIAEEAEPKRALLARAEEVASPEA